MHKVDKVVKTG